jgi:hypothetical protein
MATREDQLDALVRETLNRLYNVGQTSSCEYSQTRLNVVQMRIEALQEWLRANFVATQAP